MYCLAVCPLSSFSPHPLLCFLCHPSFVSLSSLTHSVLFTPLLSMPKFFFSATLPSSFSFHLPLSPSLFPPASNHQPSISFTPCLHSYFALRLSLFHPPSSPPPLILSSAGLRSSEQVLSPFDLGAFGLMLSAQLLKQLPPPDASQFGAGVVTYTQTHTHTHIFKHPNMLRCKCACTCTRALTHTHKHLASWLIVILTEQISCCMPVFSITQVCVSVAFPKHHRQSV